MDWWQTLLVGAVPAAITAISLIAQQASTNRLESRRLQDLPRERESREREAEASREHQLAMLRSEQDHALFLARQEKDLEDDKRKREAAEREAEELKQSQARWISERRPAHTDLLFYVDDLAQKLSAIRHRWWSSNPIERISDPRLISEETRSLIQQSLRGVNLVCSSASSQAAEKTIDALFELESTLYLADDEFFIVTGEQARAELKSFLDARSDYLVEARKDMGIRD